MTEVRVHTIKDGIKNNFSTRINLSEEEAKEYYLDKWWNVGRGEHDHFEYCYKVEIIN